MSFFPYHLMPPEWHRQQEKRQKEEVKRRIPLAVPWTDKIKWARQLNIKSETFPIRSLFDIKTINSNDVNDGKEDQLVVSPSGQFVYCEKRLPTGAMLETVYGRDKGDVLFDSPVTIPALHERDRHGVEGRWNTVPWMSITPMELLTLRPGTQRAKGRVVIAGLGLGHQLIEVSKRKQVKSIVLVERSQELVDWLMPHITPHLTRPIEIVVGDAYKVMPDLTADVALVDIFKGYGSNNDERDQLRRSCTNIKFIWAWGAAEMRD